MRMHLKVAFLLPLGVFESHTVQTGFTTFRRFKLGIKLNWKIALHRLLPLRSFYFNLLLNCRRPFLLDCHIPR